MATTDFAIGETLIDSVGNLGVVTATGVEWGVPGRPVGAYSVLSGAASIDTITIDTSGSTTTITGEILTGSPSTMGSSFHTKPDIYTDYVTGVDPYIHIEAEYSDELTEESVEKLKAIGKKGEFKSIDDLFKALNLNLEYKLKMT